MCDARRPCFLTLVPISRPFVPGGITKLAWPRAFSSGSTEATTTCTSAIPPLVAHAFWPLSTHSSAASSYLARVRRLETSEPASGSETQNAATFGSDSVPKHCGIHSPHCSWVPLAWIAATASVVPMIAMPIPASPQNSSSLTIGNMIPVGSSQNCAIPSRPYRPIFAASWITGQGVSSRSSHSEAAGRTTFSAKPCTQSRMSFWSSVRASENVGGASGAAPVDSAARACSEVVASIWVLSRGSARREFYPQCAVHAPMCG